jgi:hypothetical protein
LATNDLRRRILSLADGMVRTPAEDLALKLSREQEQHEHFDAELWSDATWLEELTLIHGLRRGRR